MRTLRHCIHALGCSLAFILFSTLAQAQMKNIATRLGYPANAKLLIIQADDLAVAHSVDLASFAALDQKAVSSASIMATAPWLTEVAAYAHEHPDADLGLHLNVTSEYRTYKWGPVSPRDQVPSLINVYGYFWPDVATVVKNSKPEEVEREIRAQIQRALAMGIHPTHLDTHMFTLAARPEFYAALVKVGHEYHLPFLAVKVWEPRSEMLSMLSPFLPASDSDQRKTKLLSLLSDKDIVLDSLIIFGPNKPARDWTASYVKAIAALTAGVHLMIVHPGYDDAELQAITVDRPNYGAAWRERDFKAVTSPEFKKALQDNHIIVIGWKDLKKLM